MSVDPTAVLFACTANAIRSPIAAGLLRQRLGHHIHVESVGVRARDIDGFAIAVMAEWGIDLANHVGRNFAELDDTSFDLVISLSPEAQHQAVELTRTMACAVEFWPTLDPSVIEGPRETRLEAYRAVRDELAERIARRFPIVAPGGP